MGNDLKSDSEQVLSSISHRVVNTSENIDFVSKGMVQSIRTIVNGGEEHTHTHTHIIIIIIIISHLEYERGLMAIETLWLLIPRERSPGLGGEK